MLSYENLLQIATQGRRRSKGDRGGKIKSNTYVFKRPEYLALRYHNTDIAEFYKDRVVFTASGRPTRTTIDRLNEFTPFRVGPLDRTKYRDYMPMASSRIFLRDAPWFGLEFDNGVACDYMGRWLPSHSRNGEYITLDLPLRGARKEARRVTNEFRKRLRPHVALRWDVHLDDIPSRVRDTDGSFSNTLEIGSIQRIQQWFQMYYTSAGNALDESDIDFIVDAVIWNAKADGNTINEALKEYITPKVILDRNKQMRAVHYSLVDDLLSVRGPEWTD